jgi:hypothetical protein
MTKQKEIDFESIASRVELPRLLESLGIEVRNQAGIVLTLFAFGGDFER